MSTEPMRNLQIIFAGFGGQGLLFSGKVVATAGLIEGRELSWLPSYGPEMRGGTANCSVNLSDEPIGSPLVTEPNILVAMNQPSYDKFIDEVAPGGLVFADTTMIARIRKRDDVTIFEIPATQIAEGEGLKGLANILLVGKLFKETNFCSRETLDEALTRCVPPKKKDKFLSPTRRLASALSVDRRQNAARFRR